jgi:undecaprenyl-diphosphatase
VDFFSAILLGLVQGLTEFLPISSSAHVQIAQALISLDSLTRPQLTAFIATIQLGTELAVLLYFARDIRRIATAWLKSLKSAENRNQDSKMGWLIIWGSLPVVVIGLLFKDLIENQFRSLWVIAFTLIGFGLVLGISDIIGSKQKTLKSLNTKHGLLFGIGQALAVIPGVSRSGGTITVGLLLGYTREAAARYSFLLAIPAVLASGFYQFVNSVGELQNSMLLATVVATVVAFASGLTVIAFFLKYLSKGSFLPFVVWRVAVGLALLWLLSNGIITENPVI